MSSLVCGDNFLVREPCFAIGLWPGFFESFYAFGSWLVWTHLGEKERESNNWKVIKFDLIEIVVFFGTFVFYRYREESFNWNSLSYNRQHEAISYWYKIIYKFVIDNVEIFLSWRGFFYSTTWVLRRDFLYHRREWKCKVI